MGADQPHENETSPGSQPHADSAAVGVIVASLRQAGADGAIDQADGAVVGDLQTFRELGDRGRPVGKSADEEEELVLAGRDPGAAGRFLRKTDEAAEGVAKVGQPAVVGLGRPAAGARGAHADTAANRHGANISHYDMIGACPFRRLRAFS